MPKRSNNQGGFPKDKDELTPNPDLEDEIDEALEQEEATPDPLKAIQTEMETLKRTHKEEMDTLRRAIPPVTPKEQPKPPAGKETDWDNLMFTNPKEAVALIKKEAVAEAKADLRAEYQQDQGTKKFWDGFYETHKDLKEDHDLVEVTLNSNLAALAGMPVPQAMEKLADLTRERLLRYSGGVKPKGKKAVVEGSGGPTPRPKIESEETVTSLTDIIRSRRAKRATAA